MTGAAAAALIVVALAVTGALTGSIGELTSFGHQSARASASASRTGQPSGSQHEDGTGAASTPTPNPTASAAASASGSASPHATTGPGSLCRAYFEPLGPFGHPAKGGKEAWITLRAQLSKLAGGSSKIYGYCLRYLDPSWAVPPPVGNYPGGHGARGRGNLGGGTPGTGSLGNQGGGTGGQGKGGFPGAGAGRPAAGL